MDRLRIILSNLLIGIPGGLLIVMGMLMFHALWGFLLPTSTWSMFIFLCLAALIVGMLARWMRPIHGFGTAVVAGSVAVAVIIFLWLSVPTWSDARLAIGLPGVLAVLGFSTLGGWILPRLRNLP